MDLSIIMPVYNEEDRVVEAVTRALDVDLPGVAVEVVVVDDGSSDTSMQRLRDSGLAERIKLVESPVNRGKGAAVRLGAEHASGAVLAVHDADNEYDPDDFVPMYQAIQDGMEAVIGTRQWAAHTAYGYWYVLGNRAINTVCNMLFNTWLSDFGAGPKMVTAERFHSLPLREPGFGFDAELVSRLLRAGVKIFETPVGYRSRSREEGKKITAVDGVKILGVFIRCRIR